MIHLLRHHRRTLGALLAAPLLTLALAAPASATAPERFVFDEAGSFDADSCGEPGHWEVAESGKASLQYRSGAYPYYRTDYRATLEITRLSTGLTVTVVLNQITREAEITDNGDGTISVLLAGTFTETAYAPDGSAALRTQGRETGLLTLDTNGTPETGDDDVEVDFDYLGFTGHDDRETTDFCDWFLDVTA